MVWWSLYEAAKAEARWQRKDREEGFGTWPIETDTEERTDDGQQEHQ